MVTVKKLKNNNNAVSNMHVKYEAIPAVTWEKYYRYSVKHSAINHSTNQSKNQSINQGSTFLVDEELEGGDDDLGVQ